MTMGQIDDKTPGVAGLYARVSTSGQEEKETIKSQIEEIKKKVKEDGQVLPDKYIFQDDGWSGDLLARPALDALRTACKSNLLKTLYVYDLGRLSRNFMNQLVLVDEIQGSGVKLISLHDINAENDEQSFARNVMGLFHDFEKKKIAERFRRGKLYKASNGFLVNSGALYGYRYIKRAEEAPPRYEVDEEEAEVVRKVFRWVGIDGLSMRGVIMKLYRLGISPRKRRRDVWSKGPIVRMLKCRSYFDGIAYYNKSEAIEAKHPIKDVKYKKVKKTSRKVRPTEEWKPFKGVPKLFDDFYLFDRVQKILEDNKRYASKNRKYDYLLTGKAYCECGFPRIGDGYSKGLNHYYRSSARIYMYPKETECKCRGVNAVVLDGLFWKKFYEILSDPALLRKLAEKWLKERDSYSNSATEGVDKLKKQIESLKEEEVRYAKMFGEKMIDSGQLEKLMKDVKAKKRGLQDELGEIKNGSNSDNAAKVSLDDLCEEAQSVIKSLDTTNKKQVIRDLVEKTIIKKGGDEVETWINIPLNQAHQMGYGAKRRNCRFAKCGEVHTF